MPSSSTTQASSMPSPPSSCLRLFFATVALSLACVCATRYDPGFGQVGLEQGLSITMASGGSH
jgi:hypothetical protein